MITGATPVYALFGHPVHRSLSPALHNAWFAELGIDGVYVALDCRDQDGADVVTAMRTLSLAGANVTVPLKQGVVPAVDVLESSAAAAGAVNTLYWEAGSLVGANTDGEGLLMALAHDGVEVRGARAAIVGAGGAARGIAHALLSAGVDRLSVLNRTPGRAEDLVSQARSQWPDARLQAGALVNDGLAGADLVIVTVPPSATEALPVDPAVLAPRATWCDISYNGLVPPSSRRARVLGHRILDGLGMLCWQAALAFERWTGQRPNAESARSRQS